MDQYTTHNPILSSIPSKHLDAIIASLPDGCGGHVLNYWDEDTTKQRIREVVGVPMPADWLLNLARRGMAKLTEKELNPPSIYLQFAPTHSCLSNPYRVVQRHREHRENVRVVACACRMLNCGTCGPERKDAWEGRLLPKMVDADHLEVVHVPETKWRSLMQRIWRQGGQYARFLDARPDDDNQLQCVDANLSGEDKTHVYSVVTTARVGGLAVEGIVGRKKLLRHLLLFAPFHRGAVSVSKGWRPVKEDRGGNSDWEVVPRRSGKPGIGRMGGEERIKEVAEVSDLVYVDTRDDGERHEMRFKVPTGMDDFHVALFVDRLLDRPRNHPSE